MNSTVTKAIYSNQTDEEDLLVLNIRFIAYVCIMMPLSTIGFILNGFTIAVLLHPRMRNSTNVYLTALSVANIICLLFFLISYSFRYMFSYDTFKNNILLKVFNINGYENFINMIYPYSNPITTTFQLFAIYLTCAVTVDRWIYLKWPLKADSICTIKSTIRVILILFAFCVIYNFPRWFEVETSRNNSSFYQARPTSLYMNVYYQMVYQQYCYYIFVYGLPFFVLLIVNIGIIKELIVTKRRKNNLLGKKNHKKAVVINETNKDVESRSLVNTSRLHSKRTSVTASFGIDPKITMMVLAVVLAFFICQFPYLLLRLIKQQKGFNFNLAKTVCDLLLVLNCCINFLIYCFFGQNFRMIAKTMLLNPSWKPYSRATIQRNAYNAAHQAKKTINNNNNNNNHTNQNEKSNNSNNNNIKMNKIEANNTTQTAITSINSNSNNNTQ